MYFTAFFTLCFRNAAMDQYGAQAEMDLGNEDAPEAGVRFGRRTMTGQKLS